MLDEIRRMGFEYAELSHGIKLSLVEGIQAALKENEIKITSLHNFCPLPLGVMHAAPNIYLLSSTDEAERERAIKQTLKTIEFAGQCQARAIVMHLGRVPMLWGSFEPEWLNYTERLLKRVRGKQEMLAKYERLRFRAISAREKRKGPYWKQVLKSLDKLVEHARQASVKLGIENRLLLEEIPNEAEFREIFERYDPNVVGYWHDVGHAHVRELLGVCTQEQMLELAGDRLLGIHIHDVGFVDEDHRPPSFGEVMFDRLRPYVRPDTIKVFEFSPKWRTEDVNQGIRYLRELWTA